MLFYKEISEYIGFTEADVDHLNALRPLVTPHFEAIVDAFYDALWLNPRTRMVFEGEAQVQRLRGQLMSWLEECFAGTYDQEYFDKRLQIGKVHVDVGLLPHFMFGAMNVVRRKILATIAAEDSLDATQRAAYAEAVEKLLDLELTIMVQSYWDTLMELRLQLPAALASGLAHEIRNPLNALNLNIALMERRLGKIVEDTSTVEPILEVMRSEINRIRGLTGEIMDFTKPIKLCPQWHDAANFFYEIEAMHAPVLNDESITLTLDIDGDQLWCDADRLKQVLVNLIKNASEAISAGGHIMVSLKETEVMSIIRIEDDGVGMPETLRFRIFDLFYTTKSAGTGLGLPIIKKIIEAHGGTIEVSSSEGQGTTFTLYLPKPGNAPFLTSPRNASLE